MATPKWFKLLFYGSFAVCMIGFALEFSALQSITQRRCLDVECFSVWGLRLTIGGAAVMIGSAIGLVLYRRIFQRDEWRQQRQQTRALMPKSYWHVYWGVWGLWFPLGIFLTITHRQEYTFLSNLLYAMWGFLFVPLAYRQAKQWKYLAASFWAGMGIFMLWLTWSNIVETKRGCMKDHVEQDNLNNARFPANVHLTPDTNPSLGCKIVYATLKAIPHDQKPSFGVCIKGVCKTVGIIDLPEVPTEYNSPPHPWGVALPQRPTPYEALVVCENGACRTEMRPRKE